MTKKKKLRTFTEVYRPYGFDGIIDIRGNIPKIKKIIKNKIKQNFLFDGPTGSGKTTTAWATARAFVEANLSPVARMMGGSIDSHITYINASDAGIETIRKTVKPLVSVSGVNVMILDEFDGINMIAQQALRPVMEEAETKISPKLFILTCNKINKIHEAIISRCGGQSYKFPKIPFDLMLPELKSICKKEKIVEFIFPPDVEDRKAAFNQYWNVLYDMVAGDMRKALKHLEVGIEIDETGRKTFDMSSEPLDLTTNAFYLQLDEILLAEETVDYSKLVKSIDELIYRREGNAWETITFFKETFKWFKLRADRFNHSTIYTLAVIAADYENRMSTNNNNDLHDQLIAMISAMRNYLRKSDLEHRQLSELSKLIKEAKELIKDLKS